MIKIIELKAKFKRTKTIPPLSGNAQYNNCTYRILKIANKASTSYKTLSATFW
jgi:hypothetical protein